MKKISLFLILLFTSSQLLYAAVFVDENATGLNNGSSWNNAYTDLQNALLNTSSGEIWVAAGSYKPGSTRADTFNLRNFVALYGGFSGSEVTRDQRDPISNVTKLNGDLLDDDYSRFVNGHHVWSNAGDNSHHVVTAIDVDSTAILDGFEIAHGWAISTGGVDAGGGLLIRNGSPTISNTKIDGSSGYYGGGAYVDQGSAPTFTNCEFRENYGDIGYGGAMHITGSSSVTFSNCHFEGNAAIGTQSPAGSGGALYVNFGSNATITSSSFIRNITGYRTNTTGGASTTTGGAIMAGGNISVQDSIFIGNRSYMGGAIYAYNDVTLINNIFNGNKVVTPPGAAGGGYGGALVLLGPSTLINNTVTNNSATENTGGIIASVSPGESVQISNTILWGNTVSKYVAPGDDPIPLSRMQLSRSGDVVVSYGILQGLYEPIPGEDPVDPKNFPGMLDADPLFINSVGIDGFKGNEDDDLHLGAGSPAIDSGDNSAVVVGVISDIDGDPRFQDDVNTVDSGNGTAPIVDMGAYETDGTTGNIPPVAAASANPVSGEAPLNVQFSSAGSGDSDGLFVTYNWNFTNGSSSTEANPQFVFQTAGVYTVLLTVTDDVGISSSDSVIITVTEAAINQVPIADASATNTSVTISKGKNAIVILDGSNSSDSDGSIVSYDWYEGAAMIGSGIALNTNRKEGVYTFSLIVTDNDGASSASTSVTVTVTKGGSSGGGGKPKCNKKNPC